MVVAAFIVLTLIGMVAAHMWQERLKQNAARDRQLLAILMVSKPYDPALFRIKLRDEGLRSVQIIGDSLSIITNSKNAGTRTSRLALIHQLVAELEAKQWDGLAAEVQVAVRAAAQFIEQLHAVKSMREVVLKHMRAAERAVKAETRAKYMSLASAAVAACAPGVTDPELAAEVGRVGADLQGGSG